MSCEQYTRINLETFHDKDWYQRIVDFVRYKHSRFPEIAGQWPGEPKGSPVVSRYPNLAAELTAVGFAAYIGNVARAAGVRPQTIASAIESGTSLRPYQLKRLAAALNVSVEYLSDPYLAAVDPGTAVGALQTARFGALLEDTKGLVVPEIERIRDGHTRLCEGGMIVYASYKADIRILLTARRHPFPNGRKPKGESKVLYIGHTPIGEAV